MGRRCSLVNLPTHAVFAAMVAAAFTGRPDVMLVVTVGAVIPDLDRDYWFFRKEVYTDEQLHRALFHNLFFVGGLFFVSPWLSLGALLHTLQDAMTTVKDRGVEWFFPVSRLVTRGRYGYGATEKEEKCAVDLIDEEPEGGVSYLYEDTVEMTKLADPDLRLKRPVPWRRTYGPALNGAMVDNWFLVGSASVLLMYVALRPSFASQMATYLASESFHPLLFLIVGIALLFVGGLVRADERSRWIYLPLAFGGITSIAAAGALALAGMTEYRTPVDLLLLGLSSLVLVLEGLAVWKLSTRGGTKATV
jgi:hypothetical protein